MTATAAQIGYGTLLELGDGSSPEGFTAVLEVTDFTGLSVTLPQTKVTNLTSPNRTEEYVSGIKDGGTPTFTCNLIVGNQSILKAWVDAGLRSNWKLVLPTPLATRNFAATPASWEEMGMTPSGVLQVKVGMKIAGAIT